MELVRTVTQADMTRYSGEGNIHSSVEVARTVGLDAPIAQGMTTLAFASELLTRLHGTDWLSRGDIAVRFMAPVYAGDTVTVRATQTDGGYRIEARNQNDALVMVGEASRRPER